MDSFDIGKTTGAIILYKSKGKKKDNTYPVKFRITHKRNVIFIASGYDLFDETYKRLFVPVINKNTGKVKRLVLTTEEKKTKTLITAQFERIKFIVEEILKKQEYSHDILRNKLKKGRNDYLQVAFDNKINELNSKGQVGTAASYTTAKNFFTKYSSSIKFIDITPQWLQKFENWGLSDGNINETSLGFHLRCLRALFNEAIRNDIIPSSSYPFHSKEKVGYKIPSGSGTKIALTIQQIKKLTALKLSGSKERCRDMFLLSFHLGGINFKDLLMLKWKNITNGEIHFTREKTKHTSRNHKKIIIPLTKPAKKIIDKWGNTDKSSEAYIIPHLTDDLNPEQQFLKIKSFVKQVNKQLKEIGKHKDIKIDGLSTYVARHSFATILKNSGTPIAFISETLGHSSTLVTEKYFKSFESNQRKKQFKIIENI